MIRSKRKTLAIEINNMGTVVVRAPLRMPNAEIEAFIQAKEGWIATHVARIAQSMAQQTVVSQTYGDAINCCGTPWTIVERTGSHLGYDQGLHHFYLPPGWQSCQIQQGVEALCKQIAKVEFARRVAQFAPQMGVHPQAVGITSAKTRWGSCSAQGRLNFSWRLVFAAESTIDYVIIHELVHLKEMNHSPKFWAVVAQHCPAYLAQRQALKALQIQLMRENWL